MAERLEDDLVNVIEKGGEGGLSDKQKKILNISILSAIILLGAFLRFYQLGAFGVGNTYYAATVQSMLTSWKNFFYGAFEPGGSITVDKPPLGFWVQAVFAYFFGVNGFTLALPQALAGVLSIPLLYSMIKRQFGVFAGWMAALALAVFPSAIATERNNTIDGLLVFVLLLATWAFLKSVRGGKVRYLMLGAFLVGLGFNIKMLQAYMVLPALYLVYFLGAQHRWWKRLLHLGAATVLLLVVSFSWAVAVDLTPPDERPYIGSSEDNTVMELILGHNGISRILSGRLRNSLENQQTANLPPANTQPGNQPQLPKPPVGVNPQIQGNGQGVAPGVGGITSPQAGQAQQPGNQPLASQPLPNLPPGNQPQAVNPHPQANVQPGGLGAGGLNPDNMNAAGPGGGGGFSQEVGSPGILRLFSDPLADEAGWLLPFVLLGLPFVLVMVGWSWPLNEKHLGVIFWIGWLAPSMAFFSFTSGIFHAYYLIMLGPAIAALFGATAWALVKLLKQSFWTGVQVALVLVVITAGYQFWLLAGKTSYLLAAAGIAVLLLLAGLGILLLRRVFRRRRFEQIGLAALLLAVAVAPLTWSLLTTFDTGPNAALPNAGPSAQDDRDWSSDVPDARQQVLLDFLLKNTDEDDYLLATISARDASPFILETGRPVLTFGGFSGSDNAVTVEQLEEMVEAGELRFVLAGQNLGNHQEIAAWLRQNCSRVPLARYAQNDVASTQPIGLGGSPENLLDFRGY